MDDMLYFLINSLTTPYRTGSGCLQLTGLDHSAVGPGHGRPPEDDRRRPGRVVVRLLLARLENGRHRLPPGQDRRLRRGVGQAGAELRHARQVHIQHRLRECATRSRGYRKRW